MSLDIIFTKFFKASHTMYDWSQVKIISLEAFLRRYFQKLDVYVKDHKSENTLFSTIF